MRIFTIPNVMSVARLGLLYPIFYYLQTGRPWLSVFFMFLGAGTDLADGWVARRFNQQSDLGRILDPLIDKINVLSVAGYLVFSPMYTFPLWFLAFLIVREIAVLLGGLWVMRGRKVVMESTRPGKLSAFFTGFAIPLYVVNWQPWALMAVIFAMGLNLYSTSVYYRRFRAQLKQEADAHRVKEKGGDA